MSDEALEAMVVEKRKKADAERARGYTASGVPIPRTPEEAEAYRAHRVSEAVNAAGLRMLASLPPIVRDLRWDDVTPYYEGMDGKTAALKAGEEMADRGCVQQRGRDRFCLCLTGEYGTGKTFLGTGIYKQLVRRYLLTEYDALIEAPAVGRPVDRDVSVATPLAPTHPTQRPFPEWIKFYAFIRAVQSAYHRTSEKTVAQILAVYQGAPVLMLDDVGDLDVDVESEDRRRLLYEVLDYRNDHALPTVITTNLTLDEFEAQFGGRTVQRVVEMAALVEMAGKNLRFSS